MYFHLPSKRQAYVEANRLSPVWVLMEVAEKADGSPWGSYTKSVETGGSRWK